jgi:hypothetical protein
MKLQKYRAITFLLFAFFVITPSIRALAQQWEAEYWDRDFWETSKDEKEEIFEVAVSATYASQYIWRGFDKFNDKGALQPSIDLSWRDTGISAGIWSALPLSGGSVNNQEMRYFAAYSGSLWKDTAHVTNYSAIWTYYDFHKVSSDVKDAYEGGVNLSWPRLIPMSEGYLVPRYYIGNLWPAKSGAVNRTEGGWIHILGFGYVFPVYGAGAERQLVHLSSELVYNDGQGPGNVNHDFSHAVLGVSSVIKSVYLTMIPSVNYQISLEDTVNDEDELWFTITFKYKF